MRHRSVCPLNSAPDAGQRISYYAISAEAVALLDELGIWRDATVQEAYKIIELRMKMLNVEQRQKLLARIGKLIRSIE